jgi:hypothetical protein
MKSIFVIFGFPYVDQLVNVLSAGGECLLFSTFLFLENVRHIMTYLYSSR